MRRPTKIDVGRCSSFVKKLCSLTTFARTYIWPWFWNGTSLCKQELNRRSLWVERGQRRSPWPIMNRGAFSRFLPKLSLCGWTNAHTYLRSYPWPCIRSDAAGEKGQLLDYIELIKRLLSREIRMAFLKCQFLIRLIASFASWAHFVPSLSLSTSWIDQSASRKKEREEKAREAWKMFCQG